MLDREYNNSEELKPTLPSNLTSPNSDSTTKNTNQSSENMEVHHHSHASHGAKNWKSYIWEFLMLFLAVFCGFMAEYQLEHMIEGQREKEYIKSMIEDAETDRINIKQAIEFDKKRMLHLDTLSNVCLDYTGSAKDNELMYKHYVYGLIHPSVIAPTERTMTQLKNAGGMRLIKSKNSTDKIVNYDAMAQKLHDQRAFYELYQNNSIGLATKLFYFKRFNFGKNSSLRVGSAAYQNYFKLYDNDQGKLVEFSNQINMFVGVVQYYNVLLGEMDQQAVDLIQTLKKEYKIQ
ncbi:hypothetical protein [Fibrella aquatilis]|uniref:Uncharacterized protein n=1 Tax=Fibrella aquatilis TaxID=2817059 RepID=A0A939G423_9BACT|nr:hypothetical protein [Fibrella aquatilis]MBO0930239.1 hypothetical protein [Fibrella aquatilis]